jgi:phosphatidylinositol alpha-mannosyltransferase
MARPLRVLLVTQSYHPVRGGIGEHVRHLGLALAGRGHAVRVLTVGSPPPGGELPGLPVSRVGRRVEVPINGSRATIGVHPRYAAAVRPIVQRSWDVIHLHSPLEPFLPWAVLRHAQAPCVGTFHNAGRSAWGYRALGSFLAPMAAKISVRTAVSRCAAGFAGPHVGGDYLVIPNGVDLERFHPRRSAREGAPRLLFVGRLEPRKGVECLLRAVAHLACSGGPRLEVWVVGRGSLHGRLARVAHRLAIDVRWIGDVAPSALPEVYRSVDLFAAPALHGESFGIVLLEALASGIPVVASAIPGFREVLLGCPAARLAAPGEPASIASALADLIPRARDATLAAQARSHAAPFGWTSIAAATEDAYREAMGGARALAPRLRWEPGSKNPRFAGELGETQPSNLLHIN